LSVGLDRTIKRFRDETLPFVADGGAELQFVFAPYGRGKTHLLRTLQEIARQKGFATSYVDCRSGQAPFASLQETYRVVAGNLAPTGSALVLSHRSGPEAIIEEAMASVKPSQVKQCVAALGRDAHLATDYRNLASAYSRAVIQGQHQSLHGSDLRALLRADRARAFGSAIYTVATHGYRDPSGSSGVATPPPGFVPSVPCPCLWVIPGS
jgi:hypothetical protein